MIRNDLFIDLYHHGLTTGTPRNTLQLRVVCLLTVSIVIYQSEVIQLCLALGRDREDGR